MLFSFIRVLKICLRFKYFSIFLKVSGLAVPSLIQIGFLYLQFYVPFVAVFWLMFGGEAGKILIKEAAKNSTSPIFPYATVTHDVDYWAGFYSSLSNIFYLIFEASFGQETFYAFEKVDQVAAQVLISVYHILATFITFSIFIAFVTSQFTTNYRRCVAGEHASEVHRVSPYSLLLDHEIHSEFLSVGVQ